MDVFTRHGVVLMPRVAFCVAGEGDTAAGVSVFSAGRGTEAAFLVNGHRLVEKPD